jgi:Icc-related predicted phosphoesterase
MGRISKKQRVAFEKVLSNGTFDDKTKIVLIHHHFNKKVLQHEEGKPTFLENIEAQAGRLKKKKKLFQLFEKFNIDLILHGHLHESGGYLKKGFRFVNAGGTIDKNKTGELNINFIEIKEKAIQINFETISETDNKRSKKESLEKAVYALS